MDKILHLKSFSKFSTKIFQTDVKENERIFTDLMNQNKEYLYRIAYSYSKNEDIALEIIQETTFKAFKSIDSLKDKCYFKTWITRILINTSINVMKANKKVIALEKMTVKNQVESSISAEEKIDLYNAIDLLDSKYKIIIILKYFNDMKIKDISDVMKIPEGTVKTYLKRAKESLNKILGEGYLDE